MHSKQAQKLIGFILSLVLIVSVAIVISPLGQDQSSIAAVQAAPISHKPVVQVPLARAVNAPLAQSTTTSTCLSLRGYECLDANVTVSTCPGGGSGCISGTLTLTSTMNTGKLAHKPVSDTLFAVDTGPNLDQYLFGDQMVSNTLKITLPITRIFSISMTAPLLNASGFLQAGPTFDVLTKTGVLPKTAQLEIAAFDIDNDPSKGCNELDRVTLNGFSIISSTGSVTGQLSGKDREWSQFTATVPITYLKFSANAGASTPTPTLQEIAISANPACPDKWAFAVDWATIQIDTPLLPTVLIHGFTGASSDMDDLRAYLQSDGIPFLSKSYNGVTNITDTATSLATNVSAFADQFGVQKVNIFAHSAGGIASRQMLAQYPAAAARVNTLFTFGTPHHGWEYALLFGLLNGGVLGNSINGRCSRYSGAQNTDCKNTAVQLSRVMMCYYNYSDCRGRPDHLGQLASKLTKKRHKSSRYHIPIADWLQRSSRPDSDG